MNYNKFERAKLREYEKKLDKMIEEGKDKTDQFGKLANEYQNLKLKTMGGFELNPLTEAQKAQMKVKHYTLHLPAYTTRKQYEFIHLIAKDIINNEPITVVHEKAMRYLLKWAYMFRNVLTEFDEQDRWSEEDNEALEKIAREFKPILDWLVEQYRIDIGKFRRD